MLPATPPYPRATGREPRFGEADSYPEVMAVYEQQFLVPRRREIADLLRHHVQTGELRADPDRDTAVEVLVNSMFGAVLNPGGAGQRLLNVRSLLRISRRTTLVATEHYPSRQIGDGQENERQA
jgi:hypothetical protein